MLANFTELEPQFCIGTQRSGSLVALHPVPEKGNSPVFSQLWEECHGVVIDVVLMCVVVSGSGAVENTAKRIK